MEFLMLRLGSVCLAVSLLASSAMAAGHFGAGQSDGLFFEPYVGADYEYRHYGNEKGVDEDGEPDQTKNYTKLGQNGGDVHVGVQFHKNFAIEAGYFQTADTGKNQIFGSDANSKVSINGATLDLLGYLPVTNDLDLIGTVGGSYSHAKLTFSGADANQSVALKENEFRPRAGAGFQYWLTDYVNLRTIARYQGASFDDFVNNGWIVSTGINAGF
jgi:hypothetical protein